VTDRSIAPRHAPPGSGLARHGGASVQARLIGR
jgi:hypothetical protein